MKFLFKIWSNYDGFTPAQLPARTQPGGLLELHWAHYIEAVDNDSEIWVYFHGRHAFTNGVYVKGVPDEVDLEGQRVLLRIREQSLTQPLIDAKASADVAAAVAARGRQVFVLPEFLDVAPMCSMSTSAASCRSRRCGSCPTWQALPRIHMDSLYWPANLPDSLGDFVPAYWVIVSRSFLHQEGRRFKTAIKMTSEVFYRFKTGEEDLAFPLALGMRECLADRELNEFDAVIPVPLSPEKEEAGEIHRTRLLATELARLLKTKRCDALTLTKPTSKRVLQGERGYTPGDFESTYLARLEVDDAVKRLARVVLVDDVCTKGNTLAACVRGLHRQNRDLEVVAATAGQMTVKAAVARVSDVAA